VMEIMFGFFYLSLKTKPKEVFYMKVVGNFISFLIVSVTTLLD